MEYPNWFVGTEAVKNFENYLTPLAGKPNLRFLQLGAFTGDASVWMLENILTGDGSDLTDVDTWQGSDEKEHHEMDFYDVYQTYRGKTQKYKNLSIHQIDTDSFLFGRKIHTYDFIYIDADHTAFQVLKDGINSWAVLKPGGILAFDDYGWSCGKGILYDPKYAIDVMLELLGDQVELLEKNWQVWIKKK